MKYKLMTYDGEMILLDPEEAAAAQDQLSNPEITHLLIADKTVARNNIAKITEARYGEDYTERIPADRRIAEKASLTPEQEEEAYKRGREAMAKLRAQYLPKDKEVLKGMSDDGKTSN